MGGSKEIEWVYVLHFRTIPNISLIRKSDCSGDVCF